jgi:hypothetical protein
MDDVEADGSANDEITFEQDEAAEPPEVEDSEEPR